MHPEFFGKYLLELETVDSAQLEAANNLLNKRNKSLGELAVDSNMLRAWQVVELNREQHTTDSFLGELAVKHGYLTNDDIERLVILQQATQVSLGQILVDQGIVTFAQLKALEQAFNNQQREIRQGCEAALRQLPQAEVLQVCLHELIKGLQRVCRQIVRVTEVNSEAQLLREMPYVVLQKICAQRSFHFGLAVPVVQVQRIARALSGDPVSDSITSLGALERFSEMVVQNVCDKLWPHDSLASAEKPKSFYIGEQLPSYQDMIGVKLVSEEGSFYAVFFMH